MTEVRSGATFSPDGKLRWTLTRDWDDRPRVCFIGHNPSDAGKVKNDPTVCRWMHFARYWGFGGLTAVNLYPVVTSDAAKARQWADWESNGPNWYVRDALHDNLDNIIVPAAKSARLIIACWGAIATDQGWVEHVVETIMSGEEPWPDIHVFQLTQSGHPIHPMARGRHRVPNDARPIPWRVQSTAAGEG